MTVVGARPQFIKAAAVGRALRCAGHSDFLVHTGQHYDHGMSGVFFDELEIPPPDVNLAVGSASHARQTADMMVGLESVMLAERPDWVIVHGDTNSTLAGALTACKLSIPIAHVEAGLRSYNRTMPEEHNRVLTDHCSTLLFCPTRTAVRNLEQEGLTSGVLCVGDVMYDSVLRFAESARQRSEILQELRLEPGGYFLATVHRAYNTDDDGSLGGILDALQSLDHPVVFPVHPRTRGRLGERGRAQSGDGVRMIDPVGYLDMLALQQNARAVLTDSGGMQKEAFFLRVPCVTLRPETEWVETVESGWNVVTGTDPDAIVAAALAARRPAGMPPELFGDGHAAERIVAALTA